MSDIDDFFGDEIDAEAFDAVVTAATSIPSTHNPIASGSGHKVIAQKKYIQPTIFGASQVPPKPSRNSSSQYQPPVPKATQQVPKVKTVKKWDRLSAVKTLPDLLHGGGKKNKKKSRAGDPSDEEEILDEDDFDSDTDLLLKALQNQDASFQQNIPMKLQPDPEAMRHWIYSINKPKRKYQYDIVARALFNNCLVSLPTGLGKTFIAAVVMLNFYRWYPKGKVIFLAPTRPLVHQQIEACHSIAGIPSVDCASLTGTISAVKRAEAWVQKRVIFATPQTVANDLRRGSLRPEDVICVVVDEAHRATGAYAYCVVVKLLMRFNPHFRVLALTATPGSDPERVQCVIDNLHIGHIEVRTEESMDIKPYTKNKEIVLEKIALTPELISIRDQWGKLMLPLIKQCGALFHGSKEPAYIHAFSITSAQINMPKERSYLRPNLTVLSKMATAMAKLLEYSIPLAYEKMKELKSESNKCARGVCSQVGYKSLMEEIEQLTMSPGFVPHPKMEKMKALTIDFFVNAQDRGKSSRVMIFCHFRDMVTDIVSYLNQERPLIKASPFIGQSNDVRGNRGMNQKTQNSVIQQFKNDEFNVLVATSIGEEGLDIGALDFIICYEAQKSPLRMLQRLGRTGRNEDGKVIVLIAEGREDKNWEKAQDQYQHVQNALLSKKVLELYEDCERLVPEGVRPTPVDEIIDVQPYIAEQVEVELAAAKSKKGKGTKRKRPGVEDIPAGANIGFVSAKDYKVPKSKAEALRERAEGALLSVEELKILKQQWSRNTTSADIQPPIDPDNMNLTYFPTRSSLGSKLEVVAPNKRLGRNVTRSYKYSTIMKQAEEFIEDDEKCEAWRSDQMARWDQKNVILWSSEMRGKGPRKPLKLCADVSKSIRRFWRNSDPATEPQVISVFSSQQGTLLSDKMDSQFSQNDLPEADEFISHLPKVSNTTTRLGLSERVVTTGLNESSGSNCLATFEKTTREPAPFEPKKSSSIQRLAAFKNPTLDPTPFEPDKSSGLQRLSAFKNAAVEPTPFAPVLGGTHVSSSKPLDPLNQQHTHLLEVHSPAASASSLIETVVPDSDAESRPQKLFFSSPVRSHAPPTGQVDKDASANNSSCHIVPDSEEPPKKSVHFASDSDGGFEELDPEELKALDRLEESFIHRNTRTTLAEPQDQSPVKEVVISNPSDDISEIDTETLAALDGIEKNVVKGPTVAQESTKRTSPVTPNVLSIHRSFPKKSALTSQDYDHSPLLFRTLGKKNQPPVISEQDNGDTFVHPSTMMLGTQMPCNKRIPRAPNKGKRVITNISEEEDEDDQDQDQDHGQKKGRALRLDRPPVEPNLPILQSKGKQKMVSRPRRDNEWALKTGFFDMEAMGSGSSGTESEGGVGQRKKRKKMGKKKKKRVNSCSEEEELISSENSIDRDFLVHTSSSNIKDNCSPDKSMTSFYRASILMMSQPLSVVKKKLQDPITSSKHKQTPIIRPPPPATTTTSSSKNNSWKTSSHHLPKSHEFINSNDDDHDHFSFDSFCVPDEETIEFDDHSIETSDI